MKTLSVLLFVLSRPLSALMRQNSISGIFNRKSNQSEHCNNTSSSFNIPIIQVLTASPIATNISKLFPIVHTKDRNGKDLLSPYSYTGLDDALLWSEENRMIQQRQEKLSRDIERILLVIMILSCLLMIAFIVCIISITER